MSRRTTRRAASVRFPLFPKAWETLEQRTLLSATVVGVPQVLIDAAAGADGTTTVPSTALTPSQMRTAYGVNSISLPKVATANGAGQTIAIIDAYNDPNALGDLETFDAQFGLANPPSFKVVNQTGGATLPASDTGDTKPDTWELEESLDIEWTHAIAPGANIILFEANSSSLSDLFTAVQTAKGTAGVSVVSMSFSTSGDFNGETSYDSLFTSNAGQGVTFLGATGDSGGAPGFPAVSPNVIGVGGTTLSTTSSGAYLGESAWSGSSGGLSTIESQPSYQSGVVTQSTTRRAAPDVAMDADPNSGVAVYDSYDGSTTGGNWFQVGGTSLATPMWAGLISIVDQGRVANGLGTYDGRTGTLPRLYTLPASDFNAITSGSNNSYSAGSGYNLVTGRGSPIANVLVPALANISGTTTPAPPTPTPPTPMPTPTAPVIASLTSSANPASVDRTFTVTANGVTDSSSTIASVSFYYQTTGGNVLLGTATSGTSGWKLNLVASAAGTYTLYATATASNGLVSTPAYLTLTVQRTGGFGRAFDAATASESPSAPVNYGFDAINLFGQDQNEFAPTGQGTDPTPFFPLTSGPIQLDQEELTITNAYHESGVPQSPLARPLASFRV